MRSFKTTPSSMSRPAVFQTAAMNLWRQIVQARQAYFLLAPIFISLGVFVYYPPLSAMYHSLFNWNPAGESQFVGLANFRAMLDDKVLINSVGNLLKVTIFAVAVTTIVPLIVAEMIYAVRSRWAQYLYRVWFLTPVVAPLIVVALLWRFIYDPSVGLLNALLDGIGLHALVHGIVAKLGAITHANGKTAASLDRNR